MINETIRKPVALAEQPAKCADGCTHHDAITCISIRDGHENISRLNALLLYAVGDIDKQRGGCSCPCHRDANNRQVDEQTWLARVRKSARKDRAVAK